MRILDELASRLPATKPFLSGTGGDVCFSDILAAKTADLSDVRPGEVVALIGDFDAPNIATLLHLIDAKVVLVPLAMATRSEHPYFFEAAHVDHVIENGQSRRLPSSSSRHPLLQELSARGNSGLVLFSSGTTGRPKAVLHDFEKFLTRYRTPRPSARILSFLMFDHIGGLNTLFHTIFNAGVVVIPSGRTPAQIVEDIDRYDVEVLPTTPTFLRMLLLSGCLDTHPLPSLKLITYGTERMDQGTLSELSRRLPHVDFRQTYGMSELGILRIKSKARDSLWMKVGGEGVSTKVEDGVLFLRAANRMMGYLNAPDPFVDGWYNTGDLVEQDGEYLRVVGRTSQVINVAGLKILPAEIERVALLHPGVLRAKAVGVPDPLIGQHIEVTCEGKPGVVLDRATLRAHFKQNLAEQFQPQRIRCAAVGVNHRYKQE